MTPFNFSGTLLVCKYGIIDVLDMVVFNVQRAACIRNAPFRHFTAREYISKLVSWTWMDTQNGQDINSCISSKLFPNWKA